MDLPTINVLSLCSGGGGLERGVGLACGNARVVCSVEHEAYAIEILASQMENGYLDAAPIWTDLRTFDGKPWRGVVDMLVGGYPCQPFSVAGKRAGTDDPRHLWPHIARIVSEVEPEFCFFENVPGHLALGFDEVRDSLTGMGYRVAAGLVSAEEVGAPHKRERLFIMAVSDSRSRSAEPWQQHQERREVTTCSSPTVGDSTSVRLGAACEATSEDRSNGRRLQEPERGSGALADAECCRSGADRGDNARRGADEPSGKGVQQGRGLGSADAKPDSRELADASRNGRTAGQADGRIACENRREGHGGVEPAEYRPLFPPAPNDREGWMRLLEADPSLEPAVCVCADGMADRADQLRVLGNGVVPLQAAYAFLSLYACLRGSE